MLRILVTAQCDVCGDFFERLGADTTANQNTCALMAGGIIEAAEEKVGSSTGKLVSSGASTASSHTLAMLNCRVSRRSSSHSAKMPSRKIVISDLN